MKFLIIAILSLLINPDSYTISNNKSGISKNKPPHVYIIHGYSASPSDHWFPWLKEELLKIGVGATVLHMPNSSNPKAREWQAHLDRKFKTVDEKAFFVAHSLGCISLLSYLDKLNKNTKVGGLVLVSGFASPLKNLPELDGFVEGVIDFSKLKKATEDRVIIGALNDPIVAHKHTDELVHQLDSEFLVLEKGGHFLGMNGYSQLPIVLEKLKKMIKQAESRI